MRNHPIRCEGCHQTIWLTEDEVRAIEFPELWICDKCARRHTEIFTLEEFQRGERE